MAFAKLMEDTRIAIWDWNKIIVVLVTGVWVTTIAFLIQGKSISLWWGGPCLNVVWYDRYQVFRE